MAELQKIDLLSFAKEYEELIECQETDVLRTFLSLSSPYLVREEFIKHRKEFNTEYAPLPQNEKARIRKFLLNVPVGLQSYKSVSTFKASIKSVKKARSNFARLIYSSRNHCNKNNLGKGRKSPAADVNEIYNEQQPEPGNTAKGLEDVVFVFQESLPEKDESIIRSSALKSFELIKTMMLFQVLVFSRFWYLVKSYS